MEAFKFYAVAAVQFVAIIVLSVAVVTIPFFYPWIVSLTN